MLCPRCNQGEIIEAMIKKSGDIIYVCEECEATWFFPYDIGIRLFVDFGNHMKSLGFKPLWSEIIVREK